MTVNPTPPLKITVHYIVGDSVQVDTLSVPKGGEYSTDQPSRGRGRAIVKVYDKRGIKIRAVHYRRAEKIEVTPA